MIDLLKMIQTGCGCDPYRDPLGTETSESAQHLKSSAGRQTDKHTGENMPPFGPSGSRRIDRKCKDLREMSSTWQKHPVCARGVELLWRVRNWSARSVRTMHITAVRFDQEQTCCTACYIPKRNIIAHGEQLRHCRLPTVSIARELRKENYFKSLRDKVCEGKSVFHTYAIHLHFVLILRNQELIRAVGEGAGKQSSLLLPHSGACKEYRQSNSLPFLFGMIPTRASFRRPTVVRQI